MLQTVGGSPKVASLSCCVPSAIREQLSQLTPTNWESSLFLLTVPFEETCITCLDSLPLVQIGTHNAGKSSHVRTLTIWQATRLRLVVKCSEGVSSAMDSASFANRG